MADTKTKRINVSPVEERLILEHRQKTAEERSFNHALDCVLELCVPHAPHPDIEMSRPAVTAEFQRIRSSIEAMRKPI